MRQYGATCTPEEFQRTVSLVFHRYESGVCDAIHRDMWKSLPQQFRLRIDDYLTAGGQVHGRSAVLDIGCGTGLASDLLLNGDRKFEIISIDDYKAPYGRHLDGLWKSVNSPLSHDGESREAEAQS